MKTTRTAQPTARTVAATTPVAGGTRLELLDGEDTSVDGNSIDGSSIDLATGADRAAAARWLDVVRAVDHADVWVDEHHAWCTARGRSHRMPFERRVPLAVGLGLCELGVPTAVHTVTGGRG